jgi:hypothetical protein
MEEVDEKNRLLRNDMLDVLKLLRFRSSCEVDFVDGVVLRNPNQRSQKSRKQKLVLRVIVESGDTGRRVRYSEHRRRW